MALLLVGASDGYYPSSRYSSEGFLARIFLHGLVITTLIAVTVLFGFLMLGQSVQYLSGLLILFYFVADAGYIHTALDAWIWNLEPPDEWEQTEQFFHGLWMAFIIILADSPLLILVLFINEWPILLLILLFYIPINGLIAYKLADYYMIEKTPKKSPSYIWNSNENKFEMVEEDEMAPFHLPAEKEETPPSIIWNASEGKFEKAEQEKSTAHRLPPEDDNWMP